MSKLEMVEPNWVDDSFWDEIDAMVPGWRSPETATGSKAAPALLFSHDSAPAVNYRTRAYASQNTIAEDEDFQAGQEMPGLSSRPHTYFVRMIDPMGFLLPVIVKTCGVMAEDQTDYLSKHIKKKLDAKWLLAEKRDIAELIGFGRKENDKDYGEYLRKEFLARRNKQVQAAKREEDKVNKQADERAKRNIELQGEAMSKVVADALVAANAQKGSDNKELAAIVAAAVAQALAQNNKASK